MAMTSTGDSYTDFIRGIGTGLASYDPNNPIKSLGTSMLGRMAPEEEERSLRRRSDIDYENWLRKYTQTSDEQRSAEERQREFAAEEAQKSRDFSAQQAEDAVSRALRQLSESLDLQRLARKAEREDIARERGGFNSLNIDNLLFEAMGKYAPRYEGAPSGSKSPTMAWGGGSIS